MTRIIVFVTYVFLSSYGLYKIKAAPTFSEIGFLIGCAAYILGFITWFYILKTNQLSVAFPVAAGSLIVATSLIGFFWLNEPSTPTKITGIASIIGGIILIFIN